MAEVKPCSIKECVSGKPGIWEPSLNAWADGHNKSKHKPSRLILMGLTICDDCRPTLNAEHFISDDGWKQVKTAFYAMGRAQPERETAFLTWAAPVDPNSFQPERD